MPRDTKIATVRGVPCVVLERETEYGIVLQNDDTEPNDGHPLYVAPDGTLFMLCEGPGDCWYTGHPFHSVERRLRRLAKEFR